MRRGMWAMITLLDVLDCSFSDSLVQRFSAPGGKKDKESSVLPSELCLQIISRLDKLFSHPALQSQPTPWCPHRQRWPDNAVWAGWARSGGTQHHARSSGVQTGCCWTARAQSHEPPSHSLSAGLKNIKTTMLLLLWYFVRKIGDKFQSDLE